jgi:hypothetical protein
MRAIVLAAATAVTLSSSLHADTRFTTVTWKFSSRILGDQTVYYNAAASQNVTMPVPSRWSCTKDAAAGESDGTTTNFVGRFRCTPSATAGMEVVVQASCSATSPDHDVGHAVIYDGTKIDLRVQCVTR